MIIICNDNSNLRFIRKCNIKFPLKVYRLSYTNPYMCVVGRGQVVAVLSAGK